MNLCERGEIRMMLWLWLLMLLLLFNPAPPPHLAMGMTPPQQKLALQNLREKFVVVRQTLLQCRLLYELLLPTPTSTTLDLFIQDILQNPVLSTFPKLDFPARHQRLQHVLLAIQHVIPALLPPSQHQHQNAQQHLVAQTAIPGDLGFLELLQPHHVRADQQHLVQSAIPVDLGFLDHHVRADRQHLVQSAILENLRFLKLLQYHVGADEQHQVQNAIQENLAFLHAIQHDIPDLIPPSQHYQQNFVAAEENLVQSVKELDGLVTNMIRDRQGLVQLQSHEIPTQIDKLLRICDDNRHVNYKLLQQSLDLLYVIHAEPNPQASPAVSKQGRDLLRQAWEMILDMSEKLMKENGDLLQKLGWP